MLVHRIQHFNKTLIFHSRLYAVNEGRFHSKAYMKDEFLRGLSFANTISIRSYAQVTKQGLQKNAPGNFSIEYAGLNRPCKKPTNSDQ